jgi:hypothetical protein
MSCSKPCYKNRLFGLVCWSLKCILIVSTVTECEGGRRVIAWKKYDPENPPELNKHYLVSDGRHVDVAGLRNYFDEIRWYPPDRSNIDESSINYFAEINLPTDCVENKTLVS